MGKQIKLGIKMMRYGYGLKTSIAFVIFFLLAGILLSLVSEMAPVGAYMILAAGMWPEQVIGSLGTSGFVRSSPWKRSVETMAPTLLGFLGLLVCYLIIFLTCLLRFAADTQESAAIAGDMIIAGAVAALIMAYSGMAYKYMVAGTVMFLATYLMLTTFSDFFKLWLVANVQISFFAGALIGLAELAAGAVAEYAIACLLYKRPMSKNAQFAGLRKYL